MTEELERKFYGTDPVFVYNPNEKCNRPVSGTDCNLKKLWPVYPDYTRDMFIRAFSKDAMLNLAKRVIEREWLDVFMCFKASITKCSKCGQETFVVSQGENICIECKRPFNIQSAIECTTVTLPLYPSVKIMIWNVASSQNDIKTQIGEVIENPKEKDRFGIKNLSAISWRVNLPNGAPKPVRQGEVVPVKTGLIIKCTNNVNDAEKII